MLKGFQRIEKRGRTYDEEGRMLIEMNILNDSNFLSDYSVKDTPIINSEVAEFIQHATQSTKPTEKYTLRVQSSCIDERERTVYRQAIKEYYTEKYLATNEEIKRKRVIAFFLAIIGVVILLLAIFLEYRNSVVWMRIVDITAWVFLWEAVDIWGLQCRELRLEKARCLAYIDMKIEFIEEH